MASSPHQKEMFCIAYCVICTMLYAGYPVLICNPVAAASSEDGASIRSTNDFLTVVVPGPYLKQSRAGLP